MESKESKRGGHGERTRTQANVGGNRHPLDVETDGWDGVSPRHPRAKRASRETTRGRRISLGTVPIRPPRQAGVQGFKAPRGLPWQCWRGSIRVPGSSLLHLLGRGFAVAMAMAMTSSTAASCAPTCKLSCDVSTGSRGAGMRVSGAVFPANGDVAVGLRAAHNKAPLGGLLRNSEVQALGFVNVSQQPAARGPGLVVRARAAAQVSVPDGAWLVFSDALSLFALPSWSLDIHNVFHFFTFMNWTESFCPFYSSYEGRIELREHWGALHVHWTGINVTAVLIFHVKNRL